jgi:hypothetical protein
MFSITQFKNNVKTVRPNLFFAEIILPPAVQTAVSSKTSNLNNSFRFRCQATEFPGRTVATNDDIHAGPSVKYAYDLTYSDINLSIIASEDMIERFVFDTWMENMVTTSGVSGGNATGGFIRYYNNTIRDGRVIVYQINDQRQQLAKCTLFGAFPIGVGPLNLSWEEFDSYQRFAVTISYRYHVNDFTKVQLSDF